MFITAVELRHAASCSEEHLHLQAGADGDSSHVHVYVWSCHGLDKYSNLLSQYPSTRRQPVNLLYSQLGLDSGVRKGNGGSVISFNLAFLQEHVGSPPGSLQILLRPHSRVTGQCFSSLPATALDVGEMVRTMVEASAPLRSKLWDTYISGATQLPPVLNAAAATSIAAMLRKPLVELIESWRLGARYCSALLGPSEHGMAVASLLRTLVRQRAVAAVVQGVIPPAAYCIGLVLSYNSVPLRAALNAFCLTLKVLGIPYKILSADASVLALATDNAQATTTPLIHINRAAADLTDEWPASVTGLLTFLCGCEDDRASMEQGCFKLIQALERTFVMQAGQVSAPTQCMLGSSSSRPMWDSLRAAVGARPKDPTIKTATFAVLGGKLACTAVIPPYSMEQWQYDSSLWLQQVAHKEWQRQEVAQRAIQLEKEEAERDIQREVRRQQPPSWHGLCPDAVLWKPYDGPNSAGAWDTDWERLWWRYVLPRRAVNQQFSPGMQTTLYHGWTAEQLREPEGGARGLFYNWGKLWRKEVQLTNWYEQECRAFLAAAAPPARQPGVDYLYFYATWVPGTGNDWNHGKVERIDLEYAGKHRLPRPLGVDWP